jgi:hypothetical protein
MTDLKRDELRRKIRERSEALRKQMVPPMPPPRYDEVFFAETAWLDRIARGEEED